MVYSENNDRKNLLFTNEMWYKFMIKLGEHSGKKSSIEVPIKFNLTHTICSDEGERSDKEKISI